MPPRAYIAVESRCPDARTHTPHTHTHTHTRTHTTHTHTHTHTHNCMLFPTGRDVAPDHLLSNLQTTVAALYNNERFR
jgi:hypothetical protein